MFLIARYTLISVGVKGLVNNTDHLPLSAMTFDFGFIMAESAEIGLLVGLLASAKSMMTTWAVSPTFSRTQINLSDSIVRVEKPILAALMPTLCS